jgi:hypothetical protein
MRRFLCSSSPPPPHFTCACTYTYTYVIDCLDPIGEEKENKELQATDIIFPLMFISRLELSSDNHQTTGVDRATLLIWLKDLRTYMLSFK